MRRLFLLRHLKSSWDEPSLADVDRPLAPRGLKAGKRLAGHLAAEGIRPDLILCSAAARTRATLELTGLAGMDVAIERRLHEASAQTLLQRLREVPAAYGAVMLIGHNPGMEQLAALLCNGQGDTEALRRMAEKFPTGALAVLEVTGAWCEMAAGGAVLKTFVQPADYT